jgi:UDP-GlcNAc:undecaprenyl-phosphate/decaprenyl-phosphate GlcNAc-1-phosphate transferase
VNSVVVAADAGTTLSFADEAVVYGAAFLLPLATTVLLTPAAASLARRLGVLDRPDTRKHHLEATPYLGGAALALGLVVAGFVLGSTAQQAVLIAACGLVVFGLGLYDDLRGLGPLPKVSIEAAIAVVLWAGGVRAGFFGVPAIDLVLTIAWVLAITNAVNLTDNMDGLASGIAAIASLAYFAIAAPQGDYLVAAFAAALAGASLGFLRHNFPPARIFLGDAGSLLLGFLLASLGLLLDLDVSNDVLRIAVQVLILGVPVLDTALVIVARRRAGRPITEGGTDHASHRLVALGLTGREVALVAYAAQIVCSAIAVVAVNRPGQAVSFAIIATVLGLGVVAAVLSRARRASSTTA